MSARTALIFVVALVVTANIASAQQPTGATSSQVAAAPTATADPESAPPEGRALNGHVFIPTSTVPGALTTTSFGTFLVLGIGNTSGNVQIGGKLYSGSYDYAGVGAVLGYEYAFLKYFSARITVSEIVYSGIDGDSALVVGSTLGTGFTGGVTASLPIGDTLRVGVLFDAGIAPGLALTIADGLRSIINACNAGNCDTGQGNIFKKNNATTIQPAVAANWSPWRPLGVTANVAYLSVSQDRGASSFTGQAVSIGTALDFDLRHVWSVPIGLQAVVAWTAPISGEGLQHITDLGGGIFYTGREHLSLGIQFVSRRFAVQPNVDVSWGTTLATVGLRYYW